MSTQRGNSIHLQKEHLRPGMRLGVAVSGGADSVALLRVLDQERKASGLVLTVLHVQHGIRGAEAEADAQFVEALAQSLELPFLRHDVDTPARAASGKETIEEAARKLRYAWFDELLGQRELDAVATAHTLEDQAETVLLKMLRGAWTEGMAGIYPLVQRPVGLILRPLLQTRRAEIEACLREIGQPWREDATNQEIIYARNRIRHHLLPELAEYNPQAALHLARMAEIARDEESYWQAELTKILPSLLLPGKAVRGGGRSSSTHPDEASLAVEVERLRLLHPALRRRVVRAAVEQLGGALNFEQTELLLSVCAGKAGRRENLTAEIRAERTPRELRLVRRAVPEEDVFPEYTVPIPGEVTASAFGFTIKVSGSPVEVSAGTLRIHKPGDRVLLRYSRGPKRIKEILERLQIPPSGRRLWPVLEWQGEIVWMRGAELDSKAGAAAGLKVEISGE